MLSLLSSQRSPRGNARLQGLMITVWISLCFLGTSGQGSSPEVTARAGETVTLPAPVTTNIFTVSWYRGTTPCDTQTIFTYNPSTFSLANGPQHTGREVALSDGSLQIIGVRTSDTGAYTVSMALNYGSIPQRTTQLRVYGTEPSPATPATSSAGTEPSPATPATTSSCWQVALVVALGVMLGAAVIIAGVIVYYKRLLDKKLVQNDQITWENTRQGNIGQPANEKLGADSTYTELNYGDQATYEQLNR
ncbi:carcinoembryonic antigen-related cell adhesion molecule 5-like isoform X2 [Ambystoma mexicanum]